ncbi:MAG: hypothetical protein CMH61_02470 [Nanoarchaeota archaeon]|nr:hypothetical protein [Nanoarchaeota archaeon]|tara:strand:- start:606 stop:1433 length:828 start_codon:yes stop_codon:yes gene_type:complete
MNQETNRKILNFIASEPRAMSEIAQHIEKSWKTADKYVQLLKENNPNVLVKVFRKGSHGALKVAFLKSMMKKSSDQIKDKFFNEFLRGKKKHEFDVLDFYSHLKTDDKNMIIEQFKYENVSECQNLVELLRSCDSVLRCLSGNLSWINMEENGVRIIDVLQELVNRGVEIKVLCRIDAASMRNIYRLRSLGDIKFRHVRHPLRGFIVDQKVFRLKEEMRSTRYRDGELNNNLRIFYDVAEPEWVQWMGNIFNYSFDNSMNLESYEEVMKMINQHI